MKFEHTDYITVWEAEDMGREMAVHELERVQAMSADGAMWEMQMECIRNLELALEREEAMAW